MFIRTKDNRIFKLDENKSCVKQFYGQDYYFIHKENSYRYENGIEISRQADTIEELCDGIIMTYTEYETEYFVYERLDDIPLLDLKCKNKYFNIYGFIETDKGLIYVAKMNEDGKMVLI